MKLRTLAKIIGGLIALIIIALLVAPMFISADYLKSQLVSQVKAATGRTLEIKGKTSLRFFPNIAVSAEDVTLSNPAGFNGQYFLHVEKLATGVALKPLLAKQLSITGITLDGAQINLEQNAAGAQNWSFSNPKNAAAAASAEAPTKEKPSSASPLDGFALGDVSITHSGISYAKAGAKPLAISDIDLKISGADGRSALKLDGKIKYQNEPVEAKLTLDKLKPFMGGELSPITLDITLPQTTLNYSGKASLKNGITAEGPLKLSVSDLPKLLTWATGTAAAPTTPKQVTMNATLAANGTQAIGLNDLTLKIDELMASGKLAFNAAGVIPGISGNVHVTTLDLDKLSSGDKPAASSSSKEVAAKAPSAGWSDAPIDASALRSINTDLDLSIDTLRSGKLEASKITANVTLNGGNAKLTLTNAVLYNGVIKGDATLDGATSTLGLNTHMNITGVEIEPLMTAISGKSRLAGTTTLNFGLTSKGASERALVNALSGSGALKVENGAVKGVNIANFLRNAKQGFLFSDDSSAKTDFTELTATFTVANGILTNNDLAMKSPILRVAGKGTVDLPQQSVNYVLTPTIVGSLEGQGGKDTTGIAVPLKITGPWSNPSVTPDVAGMLQQNLKDPAALKQNVKALGTQLKGLNSPKDIGAALFGKKPSAAQ